MSDDENLARLVKDLGADPAYATGTKRYHRRVTADDAAAVAAGLHDEVDVGVEARAAAAAKRGLHVACAVGCTACCNIVVMTYEPEALAVARWLERPENAAARARFLDEAYPRWRAAVGDGPELLAALAAGSDEQAYWDAHLAQHRRGVRCPFNDDDGRCTVYPARPVGCRVAHALDTPDRCGGDGPPPAALAFVPLDDFVRRATRLLRAVHNTSTRPRHRVEAIPVAVHRLLGGS